MSRKPSIRSLAKLYKPSLPVEPNHPRDICEAFSSANTITLQRTPTLSAFRSFSFVSFVLLF